MKNHIEISENSDSENRAIENGYKHLTGHEIKDRIVGKQFFGGYLHGFQYIISINSDGSLEGKNNYQHHDIGSWTIDMEENTMKVSWKYGWDNTTTRLYEIGEEIRLYDKDTGKWRSSLSHQVDKVQNIENYQF